MLIAFLAWLMLDPFFTVYISRIIYDLVPGQAYFVSMIPALAFVLPLAIALMVIGQMQMKRKWQVNNTDKYTGMGNIAFGVFLGISVTGFTPLLSMFNGSMYQLLRGDNVVGILFFCIFITGIALSFLALTFFILSAATKRRARQKNSLVWVRVIALAAYLAFYNFAWPIMFYGASFSWNYPIVAIISSPEIRIVSLTTFAIVITVVVMQIIELFQKRKGDKVVPQ